MQQKQDLGPPKSLCPLPPFSPPLLLREHCVHLANPRIFKVRTALLLSKSKATLVLNKDLLLMASYNMQRNAPRHHLKRPSALSPPRRGHGLSPECFGSRSPRRLKAKQRVHGAKHGTNCVDGTRARRGLEPNLLTHDELTR